MHDATQNRLIRWAVIFLFTFSVILTLAPAVRERTWDVDYRLSHWVGFGVWLVLTLIANRASIKYLPERDPYLLPAAMTLSGWGLLTIWRLDENFGLKQTLWLGVSVIVIVLAMRIPHNLSFLRRYKYVLLVSGLLITGLTVIFGSNPLGVGPRLWLGCCGIYFQPSEPLKLLLVSYLAAYLADHPPMRLAFPLFVPTILVTGLALLLLVVQNDLGTASIFISIFTIILFLSTGKKRVLSIAIITLTLGLFIGYFFITTIHIRVDAWLNPWADPAGSSFQIVQSLLAVANGGILGRGPGLGSPLLVPVAISDFIFAAITEETGLVGAVGLLGLIWFILARGLVVALRAADRFRRTLAAGIVAYLGLQSLLIIGGNLRLLPLTGVTLPFVSYGGSSLLTSFIAMLLLLIISNSEDEEPAPLLDPQPFIILAGLLAIGLAASAMATSWWAVVRSQDLLDRTDNGRRAIADRYVPRGAILDRNNNLIDITEGTSGSFTRIYRYPDLAPVVGYTHPIFGQAGLEASMDDYLRGMQGNPSRLIWWDRLVYGTPPPGLDLRLSLDLTLQSKADLLLGGHRGALILMNAKTGEILAMASHPTYDPNQLDMNGADLSQDKNAPLVNRAAQGLYPIGTATLPIIQAQYNTGQVTDTELLSLYHLLGLFDLPKLEIPLAIDSANQEVQTHHVSPLQMTLAAASLSNHGTIPAPRIAMAVNTPEQGWVVLPATGLPVEAIQPSAADEAARSFIVEGQPYWSHTGQASMDKSIVTWVLSGTLPDWGGTPLTLVVTLEENNTFLAEYIRDEMMKEVVK